METAIACESSFKARAELVSQIKNHVEDPGILHNIAIETAGWLLNILENKSSSKQIYPYQAITEDSVCLLFSPDDCDTLKRLQTWCQQQNRPGYLETVTHALPSKSYFVAKGTEKSRDVALTIIIHTIEQGGSVWSSQTLDIFFFFADKPLLHRFRVAVQNAKNRCLVSILPSETTNFTEYKFPEEVKKVLEQLRPLRHAEQANTYLKEIKKIGRSLFCKSDSEKASVRSKLSREGICSFLQIATPQSVCDFAFLAEIWEVSLLEIVAKNFPRVKSIVDRGIGISDAVVPAAISALIRVLKATAKVLTPSLLPEFSWKMKKAHLPCLYDEDDEKIDNKIEFFLHSDKQSCTFMFEEKDFAKKLAKELENMSDGPCGKTSTESASSHQCHFTAQFKVGKKGYCSFIEIQKTRDYYETLTKEYEAKLVPRDEVLNEVATIEKKVQEINGAPFPLALQPNIPSEGSHKRESAAEQGETPFIDERGLNFKRPRHED
jgi:hypothetical protein